VQVARGLYGGIIVRAPDDPLPATLTERLLILSDNRFLPDGTLDLAERHSHQGNIDFENGREGDVLFVNGAVMPTLEIRPGEVQRWRIINASAGRYYRLALSGHEVVQVGTEGGLFERPVPLDEILLAVAERVELLVRGGEPGSTTRLQTLPYNRYIPQTRPGSWNEERDLLTLRTATGPPAAPVVIPATLRPIEALDTSLATATRVMVLSQGFINGQLMDMDRVDVSSRLGATEIWQVENIVGMDHPFHLHGFQFQVLDRNGVPEPFPAWKDTVNVPKKSVVRFIVRYANYPGKWMFHCHILDHEDHGMMGVLEVISH
jgi:bilirubin oxidase